MTTIKEAKAKLATLGWTIRKTDCGDYRVAPSGAGNESVAYYSDSLEDALNTGILEAGGNPWESECSDLAEANAPRKATMAAENLLTGETLTVTVDSLGRVARTKAAAAILWNVCHDSIKVSQI